MATDRVEALKAMLAQDPNHTFARYGLAQELVKSGDLESAIAEFRRLLEIDPTYAAAYYHCGRSLESVGRLDEARETYERGIEVTTKKGDTHTRSELQAALDMLGL
jgi:tetratricopeptide (TPR) repeat protein